MLSEGIRNSKKVYKNEVTVSKTILSVLTAERVTKTSFENSLSSGNSGKEKVEGN